MTKLKETTQAILIYMTTSFFLILSQSNLKKKKLVLGFHMPVLIGVKAKATLNGKRMHVDREGEQRRRGKMGLV